MLLGDKKTRIKEIVIFTKNAYHAHTNDHISMTITDTTKKRNHWRCDIQFKNDDRHDLFHKETSNTFIGSDLGN